MKKTALMGDTVHDFFNGRLGHSFDGRFTSQKGTLKFDVPGAGSWFLSIDHGNIDLREQSSSTPDCVMHFDKKALTEIILRKRNLITTFLRGEIQVEGDWALAAGIHNYFKKAA